MLVIDAHNHLHDKRLVLADKEIENLGTITKYSVVNGTSPNDWEQVLILAKRFSWIVPSFGVHPWYILDAADDWENRLEQFLELIPSAIGEIGLDCWRKPINRELQQEIFSRQMEIAARRNLPVSIHCLKAWDWLLEVLKKVSIPGSGFLLHSYSGPREIIGELSEMGGYFSFPGCYLGLDRLSKLETFRAIPIDRLLVETDSPDQCLPTVLDTFRIEDQAGRRLNHPANIAVVYSGVARAFGMAETELVEQVEQNFLRLFAKVI